MAESALTKAPNITAIAEETGMFSDKRIEMIRNAVAKGAPDDVFAAMIDLAKRRGLDPLAKQMICVKFGGAWVTIVTIDGYRAIAEQTGRYAGSDAPVFTWYEEPVSTSEKKLIPESATVTVYKLIDGQRYPFSATVYWEEFDGKRNNWLSMPRVMLSKVAESHALRKAFPSVLSGTYTDEEMDQAYVEVSGGVVDRRTGEIQQGPTRSQNRATSAPSASTRPNTPPRPTNASGGKAGAPATNSDGKAIHFRTKISALTEPLGFTAEDLNAAAELDLDTPYMELDSEGLELLFRDLEGLHREGDLADYLKQLRAPADAIEIVDGEVVEA